MSGTDDDGLMPEIRSPRFRRFFAGYAGRLISKRFHGVRLLHGSREVLDSLASPQTPVIAMFTHASWWEPLVGLMLWNRFLADRDIFLPMERDQLRRFRFFRRLGAFGIDPDDPTSLELMRDHVLRRFADRPSSLLGLTPQGRFTDPRAPIRLRPGAAAIAAAVPNPPTVVTVAVEYVFWQDARPEMLVAVEACDPPAVGTTAGWHRRMSAAFAATSERLASAAIARDPDAFELVAGGAARINPVMDAWLRLRGRQGGIGATRRDPSEATG
ncbi:MAG: hypothetical protein CMJ27_03875 [Phycisphaerae bacterium]|nr:hypothetical protein [Phycisphaerae bacterium]OUX02627.1 MAG: hypothetical protein CBD91_02180 [Phycisphaeraceae bacterium TMED231]